MEPLVDSDNNFVMDSLGIKNVLKPGYMHQKCKCVVILKFGFCDVSIFIYKV